MKKVTILMLVIAMIFAGNTYAQVEQGTIRIGGGLAIGTKSAIDSDLESKVGLGINIGGEYFITDVISVAPSYTFFFKSTVGGVDYNFSSINADARYYFMTDDMQVYGVLGFASSVATADGGLVSVSTSETGLNVGAGAVFPMGDNLGINAQLKYQTPGDGQLVANVGVVFSF